MYLKVIYQKKAQGLKEKLLKKFKMKYVYRYWNYYILNFMSYFAYMYIIKRCIKNWFKGKFILKDNVLLTNIH